MLKVKGDKHGYKAKANGHKRKQRTTACCFLLIRFLRPVKSVGNLESSHCDDFRLTMTRAAPGSGVVSLLQVSMDSFAELEEALATVLNSDQRTLEL